MSNLESGTSVMTIASVLMRLRGTDTLSSVAECSSESALHGAMGFGLWNYRMALGTHMTHFPERRMS